MPNQLNRRVAIVAALAAVITAAAAEPLYAQYVQRRVVTTNGAVTFIGNTLGLNKDNGDDEPGTSGSIGTFISTNTALRDNFNWPFGTTEDWRLNSSAAILKLPAESRVIYAELIWGGSYNRGSEDVRPFLNEPVTFITPAGTNSVNSDPATRFIRIGDPDSEFYLRTANVTALVNAGGNGSYTVGRVPATQAASEDNVNVAGWTLAIIYENFSLPSRNLSLFVGLEPENGASASVSGFCTPTGSAPVRGRVAVSAVEGDTQLTGDTLRFGPNAVDLSQSRFRLSGPNNRIDNFFAAQINGDDGQLVKTGTFGNRNNTFNSPFFEGGRQGWDITNVDASAQLENGQTIAFVRGTSNQDAYAITMIALQIDVGAPRFGFDGATTVDPEVAAVGSVLNYTVRLDNSAGQADALNVVFRIPLPPGTSFVGGSFTLDGSTQPAANPVAGVPIGLIRAGATRVVTFKLRVDSVPPEPAPAAVDLQPSWTFTFVSCAGQPPQDATFSSNSVRTTLPRLRATKTGSPSPVRPNEVLTYQGAILNTGLAPSSGTLLTDPLPAGTVYVEGSTTLNGVPVPDPTGLATGMVVFSPGSPPGVIAPGSSATVSAKVRVLQSRTEDVVNVAIVDPDGPGGPQAPFQISVTTPVTPQADLSVSKTGPATGLAGTNITYTIEVRNDGPAQAALATLTDPTPAGLTLVSVTGACTGFPCTLGNLPGGATRTATVTYAIPAGYTTPDPITNTATVSSPTFDATPDNNSSTASTALAAPVTDLSITKTNNVTSVVPGTTTTYEIVVSNAGPSPAPAAIVRDTFPAALSGVTWTCAGAGGGACTSPSGTGDIDTTVSLPAGGSATFTATGTIDPAATGELVNTARALPSSGTSDPSPLPAIAVDRDPITPQADLSVTVAGPATAVPGTFVTYTFTATNAGPSTTTDEIFGQHSLVSGLVLISVTGPCTSSPCNLGILAPGDTRVVQVTYEIPVDFPNAVIPVTGSVTLGPDDPVPANNGTATTTTVVRDADVQVTKNVAPETAAVGETATFWVTVTNAGPAPATNVVVADVVPPSVPVTFEAPTQGAYDQSTGLWTIGTLLVGESAQLQGTLFIQQTGLATNIASTVHQDQPDPDSSNNSAEATLNAPNAADVGVLKTVDNLNPAPGSNVTFTVTLTNRGANSVSGLVVTDDLPAGLTLVSATPSHGTYAEPTWDVGTLDELGQATLVIVATVNVPGPMTNLAVKSAQVEPDFNPANDRSSVTLNGAGTADLSVAKTASSSVGAVGDLVLFTVLVTNRGPETATGVTLSDSLPAGLTFVDAIPSAGSYDAGSGVWTVGSLAATETAALAINARITQAGVITNTATVAASGQPDPEPANNSASATVTAAAISDLSITKTLVGPAIPGLPAVYRIVVRNDGPSPVVGASVTDTFPAAFTGAAWTCSADPGSLCSAANGTGNIALTVDLERGDSATITATGLLAAAATGPLDNTATVTLPADVTDPVPANNSSSVSVALTPIADVRVTKSGPLVAVPDTSVIYTIVVENAGPSVATAVTLADPAPVGLTFVSADAPCAAGFPCSLGDLAPSALVTITVTFFVPLSYAGPDPIANTATVSSTVTDPAPANNTATAMTPVTAPLADLVIVKDDGVATVTPGQQVTYTITATNNGPSGVLGATVADLFPASLTGVTWTCTGTGGATCPAAGSGNINATVNIPNGGAVTFVATGTVDPAATGQIVNTATATPPAGTADPTSASDTDVDNITPVADLAIAKTGPASVVTQSNIDYTITITNLGPSSAEAVVVDDPAPPGLGFVGNAGDCTTPFPCALGIIPAGESRTITATFNVPAGYSSPTPIVNTATVTSGTDDPASGNNSATASTALIPDADIEITKVVPVATPFGSATFLVTARNHGPNPATGVEVTDRLPAGVELISSTPSQGTYDPATGVWTVGALDVSGSATLVMQVRGTAPLPITNLAVKTGGDQPDPNRANDSASASGGLTSPADLAVQKTVDLPAVPIGNNVTFTVRVTNRGPSPATAVTIDDALPAGLTFVSATPSQGTYNSGSGVWTIGALGLQEQATLAITATVDATGPLVNNAQVGGLDQVDPNPLNDKDAASVNAGGTADLSVSKAVSNATPAVDTSVTYTVTVRNLGPENATGVAIADVLPAGVTFESATASQGTYDSGSGVWTVGDVAAGGIEALSINVRVVAAAIVVNTASLDASSPTDPNPANDSGEAALTASLISDLAVAKTADRPALAAGAPLTWTIVVTNNGDSNVTGATVNDTFPPGFTGVAWTCAASPGSSCGTASGSGAIAATVSILSGGNVTFTATGIVDDGFTGLLSNTASAAVPAGVTDPDSTNDSATSVVLVAAVSDLRVTKTGPLVVVPGNNLTYSITVLNAGPSEATSVVLEDPTPIGLTFVGISGACSVLPCALGTIPPGESRQMDVTFAVPPTYREPNPIINVATVTTTSILPLTGAETDDAETAVTPLIADISVTKTGPPSVVPGRSVTYTLTVRNDGPSAALAATLDDPAPEGLTFAAASAPCAGGFPCALGDLNPGDTRTIDVTFEVPGTYRGPNPIVNTASVTASTADSNLVNNEAMASTAVDPASDIAVAKTVDQQAPLVGQTVTFTVTATNLGPSGATGMQILDRLVAGLTFVSATPSQGTYDGATGVWQIGALADGGAATLQIAALVGVAGGLRNLAIKIGADQPDPVLGNNVAGVELTAQPSADVQVDITADRTSVNVGENVTLTVSLLNAGPSYVSSVVTSVTMPAGLTVVSAIPSAGVFDPATGQWTIGGFAPGTVNTLQIEATVTVPGSQLVTAAKVSQTEIDPVQRNDAAGIVVNGLAADVQILKTVNSQTATVGQPLRFTVFVTNNGPSDATGVVVRDVIGANLTVTSATVSQGTFNAASGLWTVGTLTAVGPGNVAALVIDATVMDAGPVTNIAAIQSQNETDPNGLNNADAVALGAGTNDLAVGLRAVGAADGGGLVVFVGIGNVSASPSTGRITFTLPLPPQLSLAAVPDGWICNGDANTATCFRDDLVLQPGMIVEPRLRLSVDSPLTEPTWLTVILSNAADVNPLNNVAAIQIDPDRIFDPAEIAVWQRAPSSVPLDGVATITIDITNGGPDPARDVAARHAIPIGFTLVDARPSSGACTGAVTVVCRLGRIPVGGSARIHLSVRALSPGVFGFVSSASSLEEDPNLGNNVATSIVAVHSPGTPPRDVLTALSAVEGASPRLGTGLADVVAMLPHPAHPDAYMVVERGGRMRVLIQGVPHSDYLDLRGRVRELLGAAFAPDYGASGRVFVSFIDTEGAAVVARFRSTGSPLRADVESRFDLQWSEGERALRASTADRWTATEPVVSDLQFGADGYLYLGVGDRSPETGMDRLAQDPTSPVGKMLRIDVGVPDADAEGYDIPPDNPFVNELGFLPEIWAFGLRDPSRFTFDFVARGGSGSLFIADSGAREVGGAQEVNVGPRNAQGLNFGWPSLAGGNVSALGATPLVQLPLVHPVYERIIRPPLPEDVIACETPDSPIVGGAVYRGAALGAGYAGRYFFATAAGAIFSFRQDVDPATGVLFAADIRNHTFEVGASRGGTTPAQRCSPLGPIRSFGVNDTGELYLMTADAIYGLVPGGCASPDPFAAIPGMWGVCIDGGWLPSGHPLASAWLRRASGPPAPPPPPPPSDPGSCTTPDPFAAMPGGGVCIGGGWVPSNHPLAQGRMHIRAGSGAARTETAPATECATPDPYVSLPEVWGLCVNGRWMRSARPEVASPSLIRLRR